MEDDECRVEGEQGIFQCIGVYIIPIQIKDLEADQEQDGATI